MGRNLERNDSRERVAIVIPDLRTGGAEKMVESLAVELRNKGVAVIVVSLYSIETTISNSLAQSGIRVAMLGKRSGPDMAVLLQLLRLLRAFRPTAVHSHLSSLAYSAPVARMVGARNVIHTVHSMARRDAKALRRMLNGIIIRLFFVTPVAISPAIKETIAQAYRFDPKIIPIVLNGIPLSNHPKTDYQFLDYPKLIHVGNFREPKNHFGLLRAFKLVLANFPQAKLTLIGEGPLEEASKQLASELAIAQSVEFMGHQTNVQKFLRSSDIFVLPSLWEGLPLAVIEAMSIGLPIVASRVGGNVDLIADGRDGLLAEPSPTDIGEAVQRLLRDQDLREQIGQAARRRSLEFGADRMAADYISLYGLRK